MHTSTIRRAHRVAPPLRRALLQRRVLARALAACVACVLAAPVARAQDGDAPDAIELTGKPWVDMDYGSFLTMSLEVARENIARKGIAIRLDAGPGGVSQGREFVVFDTDTLRCAAGWSGPGFIDWKSIVFDGSHQTHPRVAREPAFTNPVAPGWAEPQSGSFDDPRVRGRDGVACGPLPRSWARWRGLYRHGNDVVLSYDVGGTAILERPSTIVGADARAFVRSFDIGPRARDLVLQVAHDPRSRLVLREDGGATLAVFAPRGNSAASEAESPSPGLAFDGATSFEVDGSDAFDVAGADFSIAARIRTREGGTILAKAPASGRWAPDGVTLFVRGGRLSYDIGWVGVVSSRRRVDDGEWHDVLMTFRDADGVVTLWIDGERDASRELRPKDRASEQRVRIGYTAPNFPDPTGFEGEIARLAFFARIIAPEEASSSEGLVARWKLDGAAGEEIADVSGNGHTARRRGPAEQRIDGALAASFAGGPPGLEWLATDDGHLRLRIPAGDAPARFAVAIGRAKSPQEAGAFSRLLATAGPAPELAPLTRGGPSQWTSAVTTRASTSGDARAPYVVDNVNAPLENPYRAWMRLGDFDFFADGKRAAVCTWMGDVWTVDGIVDGAGEELGELTWRRIAAGLYQPLGLKIVDGVVYVLGRDQITRLRDLDGDGETDFYECFNNDAQATEHFHEFASGLQTDAEGNFYYMKGGRHALDSVTPQHGSLIRVARDGSRSEIVAYGFRAPNGLCINPDGKGFIGSDQEGHWTPANRINWITPGGYYGYQWSGGYHANTPEGYEPPICWMHPEMDRSPAAQLWVPSERWGPLAGSLLSLSYGTGYVYLVLHEEVEGHRQGGVVKLPIEIFPTGIMRGRFNELDGQLWLCGLFGWSSNRTLPGGLYRARATGAPVQTVIGLHATTRGVVLEFTQPLDAARAARTGSYKVERWNYVRRESYGSKDFRVSDGTQGRDAVEVRAARVSADGRSVFLEIPDMTPCMQMRIEYRSRNADGSRLAQEIYHTVHALGDPAKYLERF